MGTHDLPPEVLDDVVELLAACPAFVGVERDAIADLATEAEIAYVAKSEAPVTAAFVVQRGGVVIRDGGRSVDMVAQGEFCAPHPDEQLEPVEPSLVVWLPERALDLAWSASPERLQRVVLQPSGGSIDLQTAAVRTVMGTPAQTASPDETCADVAARMTEQRISSMVVIDEQRMGIVTDRDLRSRLIAHGRPADTPVGEVASYPVSTIEARAPVFEALVEMLSTGIHHLPVIEDGRLVGMVSSNDVLALRTRSPLYVRAAIDRADDVEGITEGLAELPHVVEALLAAGTNPGDCGRVVATVTDRVQRKVLELAFAEHGQPPSEFGWIAFGSQGRREQTLRSDQDHGLVLPDGLDPEQHAWWARVASWVVDALEQCGYPRCEGGVMASNDAWRHEVSGWRDAFSDWIRQPTEQHLLDSSIAFDLRTVTGAVQAREELTSIIAQAGDHRIFLGRLARESTRHRPPLGFFGTFAVERSGEHAGSFNVKAGAMVPITDIARLHALARGATEISTDDRLADAGVAGQLSRDLASTLRAGYELATGLRLRRHVEQLRGGEPADNWLDPGELDPLARAQLRETFKAIRTAQHHIESRYQTGLLG